MTHPSDSPRAETSSTAATSDAPRQPETLEDPSEAGAPAENTQSATEPRGDAETDAAVGSMKPQATGTDAPGPPEDPAPAAEAQMAAAEDQATVTQTPTATTETQTPVTQTQAAAAETQTPVAETPTATAETQTPVAETPTATAETQTPVTQTQAAAAETQTPVAEARTATTETQTPVTQTQAAAAETQAPAAEAATSTGEAAPSVAGAPTDSPKPANAKAEAAEPAVISEALKPVYEALDSGSPVTGKIIGWNKGGFHLSLDGVPAFCPKSQIEIGNPKKSARYIDQEFGFKVLEIKEAGKRIVVSRADILKADKQQQLAETRAKLTPGAVLKGPVTSLTDFGAFVDLGGLEGLVHLSQLSRQRVEHPRDFLEIGQEVEVKVLKVEQNGKRISLSMKDLEPDPWREVADKHRPGEKFSGVIVRATDFGLFVEVEPGVEGLVHTSQLPLGATITDASLAAGQAVEGWIRDVDPERQRLSLALREIATEDPWADIGQRFSEGSEVQGTIEQVAKFGLFVVLAPGLTGLLPFSAMSLPADNQPQRTYSPGRTISVQIDAIDRSRRRISLVPVGSRLQGTKSDYRDYIRKQKDPKKSGLNAMAAAFAKLDR